MCAAFFLLNRTHSPANIVKRISFEQKNFTPKTVIIYLKSQKDDFKTLIARKLVSKSHEYGIGSDLVIAGRCGRFAAVWRFELFLGVERRGDIYLRGDVTDTLLLPRRLRFKSPAERIPMNDLLECKFKFLAGAARRGGGQALFGCRDLLR